MTTTEETTKVRLTEAIESLTGQETFDIENQFQTNFDALSGMKLTFGVLHVLRRRKDPSCSWAQTFSITLKDANDYFAPEPEVDGMTVEEPGKAS
jgi:hypothetical protein